jgi:DNA-binding beta-propeller fold protein YncE
LAVDSKDHIWVLQRPRSSTVDELGAAQTPPRNDCCANTPAVIEFDTAGNVIKSWGGPGFVPDWPTQEHAIAVDKEGNVWISGSGADDRQVIKFTADGRQLLEIGRKSTAPKNNQDTSMLGRPAGIDVDDAAHEVYIADGYLNNRIVVYDSDTGAFKRGWGAYGISLSEVTNAVQIGGVGGGRGGAAAEEDEAAAGVTSSAAGTIPPYKAGEPPYKQFRSPVHCVRLSADGLVYVCDRLNDRIQIFTKQGKFVKEFYLRTSTLGAGSTWVLTFSHDKGQKYLLVADGEDNTIFILRRSDGAVVSSFGHSGRNAGQFHWVHQIGMDSKGNIYTGEVDTGKRVQKFILQK